jgi:hypothetical protein
MPKVLLRKNTFWLGKGLMQLFPAGLPTITYPHATETINEKEAN